MDRYKQLSDVSQDVHFSRALFGQAERSRMTAHPTRLTTFNAGDIVPIYCREVLPEEDISIDMDFVIRQTTLLTPTMGSMHVDIIAFFVPNRIVNQSWKAVEGENYSGSWTAPQVSLAPLKSTSEGSTQIPVGSVADYYDFPTQKPIPNSVLSLCHDLKFRGYVMIYNEFFRDQNYQPPIAMSTLNVYQGFLDSPESVVPLDGDSNVLEVNSIPLGSGDGSFGKGSILNSLYGSGRGNSGVSGFVAPAATSDRRFRSISRPLKANKLHDYFTSVLPSPQKANQTVLAPVAGNIGSDVPIITRSTGNLLTGSHPPILFRKNNGDSIVVNSNAAFSNNGALTSYIDSADVGHPQNDGVYPTNLFLTEGTQITGLSVDVADIRMASAIQQVFEVLARGGSRYRSIVASFFGVEYDDPFSDVPQCLGQISRDLDLYQTAQTAASQEGSTPQGHLAGFGYTASDGHLFSHHFVEHGYLHIFAIVRHRNIYASYLPRDNFRLNMLDFYLPQLANISEQPVFAREVNPFAPNPNDAFGFQEAWAEYRFEPDCVSGQMRTMPDLVENLSVWNYADNFDESLQIADAEWLRSNSEEVLNRTLAVKSNIEPQLRAMFKFHVDKTLPMPTYSVPGLDII